MINCFRLKIKYNKKYNHKNDSYILTFKIGASNAEAFKKCINEKLSIYKVEIPSKFLELLGGEFDIKEQQELNQENNVQVATTPKLDEEHKHILANMLLSPTPPLLRPKSVSHTSAYDNDNSSLKKTVSFQGPLNASESFTNLDQMSSSSNSELTSSQHSIDSQDSLENDRTQLIDKVNKIRSFFTEKEHNNNLAKIEKHGFNIKNSYFNGNEKSKILLNITELTAHVRDSSNEIGNEFSNEQIESLKQNISKLDAIINNKQNLETLSRYRGFSPFKCFATLWGGGKVKSIEYVEQLQEQVASLLKEITPLRPTV